MIKNVLGGLLLATTALAGCARASATREAGYQGVVELDEWDLGFELGGRVQDVRVERGGTVKKGDVLASLDAGLERTVRLARQSEADAARAQVALLKAGSRGEEIRSTQAQLRAAKASEVLYQKAVDREKSLRERHASTDAAVEEVQGRLDRAVGERQSLEQRLSLLLRGARAEELEVAEAKARAAAFQVELEDARLSRHDLFAPADGVVLDVHVKAGEVVGAGAAVVSLGDARNPFSDVYVPEGQLTGIRRGTKAELRVDGISHGFPAVVETLGTKPEFTPRFLFSERERPNLVLRVRVRVEDAREELHAGVPAFVTFQRDKGAP